MFIYGSKRTVLVNVVLVRASVLGRRQPDVRNPVASVAVVLLEATDFRFVERRPEVASERQQLHLLRVRVLYGWTSRQCR